MQGARSVGTKRQKRVGRASSEGEQLAPEELFNRLRHRAAAVATQAGFPIAAADLAPDFAWEPAVNGFPGRLVFSHNRRAKEFHWSLVCVGCGETHPRDWSCVIVKENCWFFYCFPSLSSAAIREPFDERILKKRGVLQAPESFIGFDVIPKGYYNWADIASLPELPMEDVVEVHFDKGKTYYKKPGKKGVTFMCNFILTPVGRATHHWIIKVETWDLSTSTVGRVLAVVPLDVLHQSSKTVAFLKKQLDLVVTCVLSPSNANKWQSLIRQLASEVQKTQLVTVTPSIGWSESSDCYILGNGLQIIRATALSHLPQFRLKRADEAGEWYFATAVDTNIWMDADRETSFELAAKLGQPKPLHPSFHIPDWQVDSVNRAELLSRLKGVHDYVDLSWKGRNYPQFFLTQAYGLMALRSREIASGERHFPILLVEGTGGLGKSRSTTTLAASFMPYKERECPLVLSKEATAADVLTMAGYLRGVPLILDDTDGIKRDEFANMFQQLANRSVPTVVNMNPNNRPRLESQHARRVIELAYVDEKVTVPSDFDAQMAIHWRGLFGVFPILASVKFDLQKVDALMLEEEWQKVVWPSIKKQFPHADQRDYATLLHFAIEYGSLIDEIPSESKEIFKKAYGIGSPSALSVAQPSTGVVTRLDEPAISKEPVTLDNSQTVQLHMVHAHGKRFWIQSEAKKLRKAQLAQFSRKRKQGSTLLDGDVEVEKQSEAWEALLNAKLVPANASTCVLLWADDPKLIALGVRPPARASVEASDEEVMEME